MAVSKSTRRARHQNAPSSVTRTRSVPSHKEGSEGEVTYREMEGKIVQLVKKGGKWRKI